MDNEHVINKLNEVVQLLNSHQMHLHEHAKLLSKLRLQSELIAGVSESKSQFLQDLFVLKETNYKQGGYFVEFGGTNGLDGSNSYLLEKKYGWSGIISEPARCWTDELKKNRKVNLDFRCVWNESNQSIEFNEAAASTLSTVNIFSNSDFHASSRVEGKKYLVETISLTDLLDQHNAPKTIDYLSIDTEGSELLILSAFDFSKYDIRIITCEHNWTPDRELINSLLTSKGYERKHLDLTDCDDWYVRID